MPASLIPEIQTGRHPGQGRRPAPGPTQDPVIREAARLLAGQEMKAAAPVPEVSSPAAIVLIVREHDRRMIPRQQEPMRAVRRQGPHAAGHQRPHPPVRGRQPAPGPTQGPVIREAAHPLAGHGMRAAARDPTAREHDPRPIARQQEVIRAAQRQERQAAGRRPAPVPPGLAIRTGAVPDPRASVPAPTVPTARELDLRPLGRQQERIRGALLQEQQAADRHREHSQGRQAPGPGLTRVHGPARVEPAAGSRGPAPTKARTPAAAEGRRADQRAAGVVRGEDNSAPPAQEKYSLGGTLG
jgi:hypothetical protein